MRNIGKSQKCRTRCANPVVPLESVFFIRPKYDLDIKEIDVDTYGELNHEGVNNTADHGDKVKGVPIVFEVALEKKKIGKLVEAFTFSRSMQRFC